MIITAITLLGLIMRLILANQSFWLDEGASLEIASRPFIQMVTGMRSDFHPPLYYLLLRYWLPFTDHSEWLIRLPSILIGVATIPALYFLTKEILGKNKSYIVYIPALFLAVDPFHIYYSQELRMYGLNALLSLLSWLFLLRLIKEPSKKNVIIYTIVTSLNLYTFYGAFFNLLAQIVYSVIQKKETIRVLLCSVFSILIFLPWMPVLLEQFKTGGYLTTALPGWSALSGSLTLKDLFLIPVKFIFGRINFSPKFLYYLLGGISVVITGFFIYLSKKNKRSLSIWYYLFIPIVCAVVISLKTPVLGYWRYTFILPALLLLLALGVDELKPTLKKYSIIAICLSFICFNLVFWTNKDFQREDWRGLAQYLDKDNSLIVMNFPITFAPLKFYLPNADYFYTETSLGKIRPDLATAFKIPSNSKQTIFLLDYLSDLTDPSRTTLSFLNSTDFKLISETNYSGLGKVFEFERVK